MFCDKCGNKLDDDAKFCIKCGNKVARPIKLNVLNCPNCGATTENEDGLDIMFCKYCGTKIMISGMSEQAYNARVQMTAEKYKHEERLIVNDNNYKNQAKETHYNGISKIFTLFLVLVVLGIIEMIVMSSLW